ncbi:MAG: DUF3616 domain-containing protein [Sedimentisphaerales bacterium]|nr:DUF3616 domain-containing protein [Sedimentisphaerales bacterium]
MIRKIYSVIVILAACCVVQARPLDIIIVTSQDSSEDGYAEFLQDIYLDNANVEIDDKRYHEPLNDTEKQELSQADLIIVSSDNSGGDYNYDSAFWASLTVPILSHSISVCRSNQHNNWDWFDCGQTQYPVLISEFNALDPNDPIFSGIDITGGSVTLFDSPHDFSAPNEPYVGYGTPLATESSGLPVIVRFDGNEPSYYDGSLYDPNGTPRIYFAMPGKPSTFFDNATPSGKQLLRNAVTLLLAQCWLPGDVDCDRDVDMEDFSELAAEWLSQVLPQSEPLPADILPDGQVDMYDLAILVMFWLEGFDYTAPLPDPSQWTDIPAIQDGGFIQMKAKSTDDDLHGVQYYFECIENTLYSRGWQYDREYIPSDLPIGTELSFRAKARDTSSRLNETAPTPAQTVRTDGLFYYSADASAAAALDQQRFIMADDEDNVLRVYNWNLPESDPNRQTDISDAINVDTNHPEADIEGATWYNGRVFWITSHGRSSYGDYWPSRYRFFATTIEPNGLAVVDGVDANLIDDLIQYDRIWNLGLEAAIGTIGDHIDPATIPNLAPKVNGLNIEGLCTTADGSKMYIAFRNPRPVIGGKVMALVIPLANPEAVVLSGAAPVLEDPCFIDLNNLGIRSMEYSSSVGEYLIIAGSHLDGEDDPVQYLYNYDFAAEDKDKLATFSDITPEAIFQFPDANDISLLSDDGTRMIDTPEGPVENKLLPRPQQTYRTRTIKP